jgi:hypothetical protein
VLRFGKFARSRILQRIGENGRASTDGNIDTCRERQHVNHDYDICFRESIETDDTPFASTRCTLLVKGRHISIRLSNGAAISRKRRT